MLLLLVQKRFFSYNNSQNNNDKSRTHRYKYHMPTAPNNQSVLPIHNWIEIQKRKNTSCYLGIKLFEMEFLLFVPNEKKFGVKGTPLTVTLEGDVLITQRKCDNLYSLSHTSRSINSSREKSTFSSQMK